LFYQQITTGMNVQHNCIDGECREIQTNLEPGARQESSSIAYQILHSSNNSYIVNGFSHHSSIYHRRLSDIKIPPISATMFEEAIIIGQKV